MDTDAEMRLFEPINHDPSTITPPGPAGQSYRAPELPAEPVTQLFYVAGLHHRCGVGYLRKLCLGSSVDLVREPTNPYDRNAVQVRHYGRHIGYVGREVAKDIAPLLDASWVYRAFIDVLTPGSVPAGWQVRVIVKLEPPPGGGR